MTYAVYLLGGSSARVDTEDVAQKAHEIAPGRFAWTKYPDQINLELVRVYLSDAKKAGHGRLLTGSGKAGWMMTAAGLSWIEESRQLLADSLLETSALPSTRRNGIELARQRNERTRIEKSAAWKKWVSNQQSELTQADAREIFRIDAYTTLEKSSLKAFRLQDLFRDDAQLSHLFRALLLHLTSDEGRAKNAE